MPTSAACKSSILRHYFFNRLLRSLVIAQMPERRPAANYPPSYEHLRHQERALPGALIFHHLTVFLPQAYKIRPAEVITMHFGERPSYNHFGHSGWIIGALIVLIGFTIGYAIYFLFIVTRAVLKATCRILSNNRTPAAKPGSPIVTRKEGATVLSFTDYKRRGPARLPAPRHSH